NGSVHGFVWRPFKSITDLEKEEDDQFGVQSVIVGTVIAIQEDEGWWYLGCRECHCKDETGTMSLSLFNDEVHAMVGRSAYQLCEKNSKVVIDDYNVKKLLPVFTVLRFFNDQEIINSVLACATPIKDNEATSNTVPAITSLVNSLYLESQTNENTTPNEKQKKNKRPAEGKQGSESSIGKKKAIEIKVEKDA
nr:hypothetical protein [Tanacetum cinerariifolium]